MARRSAAPRELDRSSPMPLWAQLTDEIMRRLQAGAFAERFPSELELVEQYGVSRHTVRDALRRLRDEGLLDSARGRGTKVRAARIEQPLGALYSLFREVEARGMEQRSEVRTLDVDTNPEAAQRLGLAPDANLVHLERLRLADAEPLALDHNWLPYEIGRHLLDVDFSHAGLYDQLAARAGIRPTGGTERLNAVAPSAAQRRLLRLPSGVAAFEIDRVARAGTRPVEWRLSLVRGDRFGVIAEWSPRHGYRLDVAGALPGRAPLA